MSNYNIIIIVLFIVIILYSSIDNFSNKYSTSNITPLNIMPLNITSSNRIMPSNKIIEFAAPANSLQNIDPDYLDNPEQFCSMYKWKRPCPNYWTFMQ